MYEITIKKKSIELMPGGKEWRIVGKHEDGTDKYGYTPEIMKNREIEVTLLKQEIEELDLKTVIKAINGI